MWGWLILLVGVVYGYITPGHQDKKALFKKGLIIGLILALIFVILGAVLNMNPFGFGGNLILNVIGAVVAVLMFVIGVWLGDWLEHRMKKPAA